jgi:hypothetical protein
MIKTVDPKGRISLGQRFANKPVIIEDLSDTEVKVSLARVIPEREMWLWENPEARETVLRGLEQARTRQFAENPPDIEADAEWVDELED